MIKRVSAGKSNHKSIVFNMAGVDFWKQFNLNIIPLVKAIKNKNKMKIFVHVNNGGKLKNG